MKSRQQKHTQMKNLDLKRILCGLFFLGLAGFSCFWTAESLFIWQPSLTRIGAWLIAIAFYVVASLCFSKMLSVFDKHADFYGKFGGRGGQLTIGLLGVIIFWLMVSLPTNTHTLLYRASIRPIITTDINRTMGYLKDLQDNNIEVKKINDKYNAKKEAVDALILRLVAETENPSAPGIGHRFETVLVELDRTLFDGQTGNRKLQRVAKIGTTQTQWLAAVNYYQKQAQKQLVNYRSICDKEIQQVRRMMNSDQLNNLIRNLEIALTDIERMQGIDNDIIAAAEKDLENGYAFIKTNAKYIVLKPEDVNRYTRDGVLPEAEEMKSVPDVWKDFLTTNKYDGHGFFWWVLVALLVDLSAFIFFDKMAR